MRKQKAIKVTIFGAPYTITTFDYETNYLGQTNTTKKTIELSNNDKDMLSTLIHELFHASFAECGLPKYCSNETLVTWLGLNADGIVASAKELLQAIRDKDLEIKNI